MLLNVSHLQKVFGENVIIKDATFFLEEGRKMAIVGPNGCGKSTLLKMIVGDMPADAGEVFLEKDATIGYLRQYQDDVINEKIYENVLSARGDLIEMEKKLSQMENAMAEASSDENKLNRIINEYNELHHQFELMGGLTYKSEATGVLKGLGFEETDFEKTISNLSGGQKTRVALGRLLIMKPDLLILDEPINHLDLNSVIWLEGFLSAYPKAVLLVAHDRYFLDKVCDTVVDMTGMTAKMYKGNYSEYVRQKELDDLTYERSYEKQQKEIAHQEEVIKKLQSYNREKSIKRAESRKKLLDKMDVMEAPTGENAKIKVTFSSGSRSGNDVLFVENISKNYGDKQIFTGLSFSITRGERVAIMGDNGCGKTTILKCINELTELTGGSIRIGTGVDIGYYDQEQQGLDEDNSVFEELHNAYPYMTETEVRNTLAGFLFTGDDVFKKVSSLSGGERGRLSLCKLSLSDCNFLILDEPTNHLDMESKEVLEQALAKYEGTLLFVSHDRYFVNKCANVIYEMNEAGLTKYLGNYDDYMAKKEILSKDMAVAATSASTSENVTESKLSWQEQKAKEAELRKAKKAIEKIEADIEECENKLAKIDEELSDPANSTNSAKLNELTAKRAEISDKLDELMEAWEVASEEI